MNIEKIKMYLKEKITNWYKNSSEDYGITGKFIDMETSQEILQVTFEDDGKLMVCNIAYYWDYTLEQLYNIWMETEWQEIKN